MWLGVKQAPDVYHDVFGTNFNEFWVRTGFDMSWLLNVHCIENENAKSKSHTPVTVLDWFGGPSVPFITKDDQVIGR